MNIKLKKLQGGIHMSTFLKSSFIEEPEQDKRGTTTFYGTHTDVEISIDPEITIPAPINDLLGKHMKFVR